MLSYISVYSYFFWKTPGLSLPILLPENSNKIPKSRYDPCIHKGKWKEMDLPDYKFNTFSKAIMEKS